MLSAIISDTLLLKSPTTTEKDKKALEELAKIANVDVNVYGLDMLKAGTDLSDYSSEELINLDAKNKILSAFLTATVLNIALPVTVKAEIIAEVIIVAIVMSI